MIPLYEEIIHKWKEYGSDVDMQVLWTAIEAGVDSLEKYYNKTENSPAHIVAMCTKFYYYVIVAKVADIVFSRSEPCSQGRVLQVCLDRGWSTPSFEGFRESGEWSFVTSPCIAVSPCVLQ